MNQKPAEYARGVRADNRHSGMCIAVAPSEVAQRSDESVHRRNSPEKQTTAERTKYGLTNSEYRERKLRSKVCFEQFLSKGLRAFRPFKPAKVRFSTGLDKDVQQWYARAERSHPPRRALG